MNSASDFTPFLSTINSLAAALYLVDLRLTARLRFKTSDGSCDEKVSCTPGIVPEDCHPAGITALLQALMKYCQIGIGVFFERIVDNCIAAFELTDPLFPRSFFLRSIEVISYCSVGDTEASGDILLGVAFSDQDTCKIHVDFLLTHRGGFLSCWF